jgi:hypothetical protein
MKACAQREVHAVHAHLRRVASNESDFTCDQRVQLRSNRRHVVQVNSFFHLWPTICTAVVGEVVVPRGEKRVAWVARHCPVRGWVSASVHGTARCCEEYFIERVKHDDRTVESASVSIRMVTVWELSLSVWCKTAWARWVECHRRVSGCVLYARVSDLMCSDWRHGNEGGTAQ